MNSNTKLTLQELAVLSLLGAMLFVVQVVFAFLPNIELVSVLLIVYTRVYGWKVFYPLYLFVALEGLMYGITTWFLNYLYVWAVLVLVTLAFRRVESRALWVLIGTSFGFLFGALCSIVYGVMGGVPMMVSYWISGVPFDIAHMIGNAVTILLLYEPLYRLLHRLKSQMR